MDMSMGSHSLGAPESALLASASAVIGKSFGLPTNIMQGTSDSKLPDQQAAFEKTINYLLPALAGADCITQAGALIDFALSASYEQLLIEDEIIKWVNRIRAGCRVDRETLAEEEIMSLPFGGNYIESAHTLRNFRKELYFTKLADRRSWDQWYSDGAKDIVQRAGEKVRVILKNAKPVYGIPEVNRRSVDSFAEEVLRRHKVSPEPLLY